MGKFFSVVVFGLIFIGQVQAADSFRCETKNDRVSFFNKIVELRINERGLYDLLFSATIGDGDSHGGLKYPSPKFEIVARNLRCEFGQKDSLLVSCGNNPLENHDMINSIFFSERVTTRRIDANRQEALVQEIVVGATSPWTIAHQDQGPFMTAEGRLYVKFAPGNCVRGI